MLHLLKKSPAPEPPRHEELFAQRYEQLHSWALHLTEDAGQAEDLLHDAFIEFTINRPDLNSIRHLDNYLYGVLRVLHLSQIRRSARHRLRQISIVEYDSAEIGLRMVDPREQIKVQEDLRAICHYACIRKKTSKAGSILILRFFHGYYPSEIVQILQSSRQVVDIRLLNARREAKLWLNDPSRLSFMTENLTKRSSEPKVARSSEELLSELRMAIFQSISGKCLSPDQIHRVRREKKDNEAIDRQCLGHLVSCPVCLDRINETLNLPLLVDRFPTDMLMQDTSTKERRKKRSDDGDRGDSKGDSDGDGSGGGVPSTDVLMRRSRRRAKEVFEHRPQELHIAVNGFILGSQSINAELSEQTLEINQPDPINFVEVFSEQERRLLLLTINETPPGGPAEYSRRIELSDQRTLEFTLRFRSPYPLVHTVYRDPLLTPESAPQQATESEDTDSISAPHTTALTDTPALKDVTTDTLEKHSTRPPLWRSLFDAKFWLRPGAVTALIAILMIAVVLFLWARRTPVPSSSAASLLSQSASAEEMIAARSDQVLHRTINLEVKSARGESIERRKIEIWQSADRGITARRLYDERGALVAGDWRRADGVQTLYQHGSRAQLQIRNLQSALRSFDDVWQLSPSAKEFKSLVGSVNAAQVEEQGSSYVISYAREAGSTSTLVRAVLVLSRSDLHVTEETLLVQQDNEVREYHFTEASFERRPPSAVAPSVFEPEMELLGIATTETPGEKIKNTKAGSQPLVPTRTVATPELEVEVLRLLNQAGADMGEQVGVTRTPEGLLRIDGIVETNERKAQILAAVAPVINDPAVRIEIQTAAEASAKVSKSRTKPTAIEVQRVEIANDTMPVRPELRRYFGKEGAQDSEEIGRFASRMISLSSQAVSHAGAMRRLVNQFSPDELRTFTPEARAKWLSLVRMHAVAFERDTASLRRELQPIFFPNAPPDAAQSQLEINNDADLVHAVQRLFELAATNYEIVRTSFSTTTSSTSISAIKTPQFWHSLKSTESLANKISRQ
jgi:RNA polymerase sigma factor (sigma-70 family)